MRLLQIKPILTALKHHKGGTVLIVIQIALTLAIVCNALFIIEQRVARMARPTGMVETNLLVLHNHWVGVNTQHIPSMIAADLAALRGLPEVEDATLINAFPLGRDSTTEGIRLDPSKKESISLAAEYFVDDHALPTMGAKLIGGRNFRADEIQSMDPKRETGTPSIIITKALADKLYPNGNALGKPVYIGNDKPAPSTIIGIVDALQAPSPNASFVDRVVLLPAELTDNDGDYLIRTKAGQLDILTRQAPALLIKQNRMRVFAAGNAIQTFEAVRDDTYKSDRGIAVILGSISIMLLIITSAGIVGLTSFWVSQRRKQIGVRRALGATRHDIVFYFLTENLLICLFGLLIGTVLTFVLSEWLVLHFAMQRVALSYLCTGAVVMLVLGQAATLNPALRASRVSPVEATRSI